ncbi:MAG: hypothetical protein C0483_07510 [Pirellula sp.]|nr:hypothetical protein [Pirellula sp.]
MKEILGKAKTVRELLSSAKYSIDYYQREYRWETKQIEELITDLTSRFLEDHDPAHSRSAVKGYGHYFLGSIILSSKDDLRYIVDGQQRLTSLTLLLIHLNHLQKQIPEDQRVEINNLIYSTQFGQKSFNISVEEREECMNALYSGQDFDVEGQSEAIVNIKARYDDIEDRFPAEISGESLPFFVDWLIENVHLVEITAYSDEDAYTIFETMNDRGLSLSPIDMLKGFLLANIDDSTKRTNCNTLWKERVQQLAAFGKDTDADCFKSWLRSQHAKTIRERKRDAAPGDFDRIGSEFHRWVRDTQEAIGLNESEDFFRFIRNEFDFYSKRYIEILQAGHTRQPGLEHIYYNAQAGFTLQPMLLLAPLLRTDDAETIKKKWRLCARYLDIVLTRRMWNYRSTDQSTMKYPIFKIMLAIRHSAPAELATKLKADLDAEKEVFATSERFALHGTNGRQIARILARLTDYVETASGYASHYEEYTGWRGKKRYEVEHIWADKHERHQDEFQHEADFAAYRNRLGGLLLLPKSFNGSYGALPYADKVKEYFGQNLLAKSLHPNCYQHHPGFLSFVAETGLPFKPHETFRKDDLDARHNLYRQLAERVWNPTDLLAEVGA